MSVPSLGRRYAVTVAAVAAVGVGAGVGALKEDAMADAMRLESPAFAPGETIPKKYTCEGQDLPFPLSWSGAPAGTKSFALTIFDPDAPRPQGWVHFAAYDIPADATGVPEGGTLPAGTRYVQNDFKRDAYGGPCPPPGHGVHHYQVTLYALDTAELKKPADYQDLVKLAKAHGLAEARLVGTYERKKK